MPAERLPTAIGLLRVNALLFLGYVLLAKLPSLVFAEVSPFWPPAALAVFAALVWGWRGMPGLFLASLWVNVDLFGWGPAGALWVALGNVLAPLVGLWGIRDLPMRQARCWRNARNIARFVLWMGPMQAGISALFGASGAVATGLVAPDAAAAVGFGWAVGDASASLMLVPVAHLWWVRRDEGTPWLRRLLAPEGLAAFAVTVGIWAVAFFAPGLTVPTRIGVLAAMLLPAIWSVFRLEQWLALLHLALAFILVLGATLAGLGPYASLPLADAVVGVELLGLAMSAAILFAGALQGERQQALAELRVLNRELEHRAEERAQELLRKERIFRDMIERLPAPTVITDAAAEQVLYSNPAARELFGSGPAGSAGPSLLAPWIEPDVRRALLDEVRQQRAVQNREIALARPDGAFVWVLASVIQTHFDQTDALLFAFKDISEQVRRERLLRSQAQTDALTGVPNRRHFMARAAQRLRELAAQGEAAAFVLFDLDDFKQINDTRGHACGDLVLQQVARLLDAPTRPQDVFARLGGEEFCLLLTGMDAEQAMAQAQALRGELDGQVRLCPDGQPLALPSCSVGVAWTRLSAAAQPAEAVLAELMERADAALYQAKSEGKNRVVLAAAQSAPTPPLPPSPRALRRQAQSLLPLSLLHALAVEVRFRRFFETVAQAAAQLLGADGAAFIERDGDQLAYRFFYGLPESQQQRFAGYRFSVGEGTVGEVVRLGQARFHADYASSPGALPVFVANGLKANYLVPVRVGVRVEAVLAIAWFSHRPASAPDPELADNVALLAALMAGALRRERMARTLRARAMRDALTQLPNRAGLEQHLVRAVARARRQQHLLAVGMLDLDDFKPVNDRWGHAAGDALLRGFAERLQQALRDTDFVGRLGGDEFVLVLEGLTQPDDLQPVLERLHAVVQTPFPLPDGREAHVGMSLGVALYPQHGLDADGLLRAADAALYASKTHKAQRQTWWQLAGQTPRDAASAPQPPAALAPYGQAAQQLLRLLAPQVEAFAPRFVQQFYADLENQPPMQAVLHTLSPDERQRLHQAQQAHLQSLLSPEANEAQHRAEARRLGMIHALTGVSTAVLVEALETYLRQAVAWIEHAPLRQAERVPLQRLVTARIRVELQEQARGEQETIEHYTNWVQGAAQTAADFVNRTDFMRWALAELVRLPGIVAAAFGRPDAMGQPVVEFSTPRFDAFVAHFRRRQQDYLPTLESDSPLSQSTQVRAWRNERIETLRSFAQDARAQPWREAAQSVGFRSAVSIPIRDANDRMAAILTLYGAYPNQFESSWIQHSLLRIGQLFTRALSQVRRAPDRVLPDAQRLAWRARLNPDGLDMLLQPIVDLRSGALRRVEALARLRMDGGEQVQPGEFLLGFGASEITRLFTLGLDKALGHVLALQAQGVRVDVSVNLPPEVLLQPDCPHWIAQALGRAALPPERLHLEVLESGDFHDAPRRDTAVRALSALGVRLEMDDLGSGYSSLLRLRQLPFHTVKIDQGLVREAHKDPRRVIGFIGSLIRLAHTLELDVVVEGLESRDLVEMALILGADLGQGFALARPMAAQDLTAWQQRFALALDPARPSTALGALAAHWLWEYGEQDTYAPDPQQAHAHCALSHYLRQQGLAQTEVGQLHARMHALAREHGIHSAPYRAVMAQLVAQLIARVEA